MPVWYLNNTETSYSEYPQIRNQWKLKCHCEGLITMNKSLYGFLLILAFLLAGPSSAQLNGRTFSGFSSQPEPLSLEQAFSYFVSIVSPGRLRVTWELADGHYLYRHAFNFAMTQNSKGEELEVDFVLPDGLKKIDQFFGDIEAYYNTVNADLSLSTVPGPDASLYIEYQGCADWGFCYPPQRAEFLLNP
jgi:thioredoxin:protein disulfide reductase